MAQRNGGGEQGGVHPPAGEIRPLLMPASPQPGVPAFPQPRAARPPLSPVPSFTPELLPSKPEAPFTPAAPSLTPELSLSGPEGPLSEPGTETQHPAPGRGAGFPRRIENLSPLRRAVILAEILGPPRGLSNFPAE
jgi:hypothetical protein